MPLPLKPHLRTVKEERKSGPVSGIVWQNRLADAYNSRTKFLELYRQRQIGIRKILLDLGFEIDEVQKLKVFLSSNSPAINVYIPKLPGRYEKGTSKQIFIPGVGNVIINVIVIENNKVKSTKFHEEEHAKLSLMRNIPENIETISDVEEIILNELIVNLAEFFNKPRKETEIKDFFKKQFMKKLMPHISDLVNRLIEFDSEYEARYARIISSTMSQVLNSISAIEKAYELMEPKTIIRILQTTKDLLSIEKDLTNFENQDTERYNRKQRNRMFGQAKAQSIARNRKTN